MEHTDQDLHERTSEVLEQRIRPRDEVVALRRYMTEQLRMCIGAEQLSSPLSLTQVDTRVEPSSTLLGPYREFVDEVHKNLQIRDEFRKIQEEHAAAVAAAAASRPSREEQDKVEQQLLDLQIEVNELEKRRDRLTIVNKYLDKLEEQPAAEPDFLDPGVMFKDCEPLPELPKELMEGFTRDREAPDRELQELMSRLQKAVLRNKLLAQREKRKLEEMQARNPIDPSAMSPEAQVHALNAVKESLVSWIETMLSKAGGEDGDTSILGGESPVKSRNADSQPRERDSDLEASMAEIQGEYERHLELRKELASALAQLRDVRRQCPLEGRKGEDRKREKTAPRPKDTAGKSAHRQHPQTYLLTPYIEELQSVSREQKALIQEKSHINAALAKQRERAHEMLDQLAEESQLLRKYPTTTTTTTTTATAAKKPATTFEEATRQPVSGHPTTTTTTASQIEPWLFAADSAKIATLEAVADKVEQGHMSIDEAMQTLGDVRTLLYRDPGDREGGTEGEGSGGMMDGGKGKGGKQGGDTTGIWSILDGNLGLINE
ncbi:hypothetical protein F4778DRAFT_116134 [Xylariomycetidae sp. FL2044]|nr:hypothetical protein F4778DRAFT_116134 [Xylariomycetidae sp. FL2044]